MKNILLTLLFTFAILFATQAQSLVLKDKDGVDVTGQTIDYYCTPGYSFASLGLDVYNVSDAAKSVKVRKTDIQMVEGSASMICWEACYPAHVIETPDPLRIDAGSYVTNFTGDLSYGTTQGSSVVKFTFFDETNQSDTSFVIINYIIGTLGVNNNSILRAEISNAYPNPTIDLTSVDYKIPQNVNGAYIRVNNLLGTTVSEIKLKSVQGKVAIDVSNLKDGVYFYSLIINNSATQTRKFVVKR
ncbi:MAG: T9SS type A sorting domain-containing protein [Lentimicrobium sp.]|nr:T9SS type A sorting domain-containing protein [Lentimicrobium sp.]